MRYVARLLGKPETEREVESEDPDYVADYYVNAHCEPGEGHVHFVEVKEDNSWDLWRTEDQGCLIEGVGNVLFTFRVTHEEARQEILAGATN